MLCRRPAEPQRRLTDYTLYQTKRRKTIITGDQISARSVSPPLSYICVMSNFDEQLQTQIESALREDIGDGDHSSLSCIPPDARGKAVLKIKQEGILAGMEIAEKILRIKEPTASFTPFNHDGDSMKDGETAFETESPPHPILPSAPHNS